MKLVFIDKITLIFFAFFINDYLVFLNYKIILGGSLSNIVIIKNFDNGINITTKKPCNVVIIVFLFRKMKEKIFSKKRLL